MLNKAMIGVLLIGAIAATGCNQHDKQAQQTKEPPGVSQQVNGQRDAATVLPLLNEFTPALGMEYIETVLGEPAGDLGSNFHIYIYPLSDGTNVFVQAHVGHDHGPASGKYMPGAVIRIGHNTQTIYDSKK